MSSLLRVSQNHIWVSARLGLLFGSLREEYTSKLVQIGGGIHFLEVVSLRLLLPC